MAQISGVSSAIYDDHPHVLNHKHGKSLHIPRKTQEIDEIIGFRDITKLLTKKKIKNKEIQDKKNSSTPLHHILHEYRTPEKKIINVR